MKLIKVYGCSKDPKTKDVIRRASVYFLDCLLPKKRKINVQINVVKSLLNKENVYGECHHLDRSKYLIRLDSDLSIVALITTLAHEFVHVRQFDTKQLAFTSRCSRWNNIRYESDEIPYDEQPWEIEASSLESSLATNFWINNR